MKSMLHMMRDMHMMNPMMGGMGMGMGMNPMMMGGMGMMNPMMMGMHGMMGGMHGGCHRHYGCGHHGPQHCVYFGMDLVCNAMMVPMMYPPMMGGLMPMGSGMNMNQQTAATTKPKKTMVVVHSKGAK